MTLEGDFKAAFSEYIQDTYHPLADEDDAQSDCLEDFMSNLRVNHKNFPIILSLTCTDIRTDDETQLPEDVSWLRGCDLRFHLIEGYIDGDRDEKLILHEGDDRSATRVGHLHKAQTGSYPPTVGVSILNMEIRSLGYPQGIHNLGQIAWTDVDDRHHLAHGEANNSRAHRMRVLDVDPGYLAASTEDKTAFVDLGFNLNNESGSLEVLPETDLNTPDRDAFEMRGVLTVFRKVDPMEETRNAKRKWAEGEEDVRSAPALRSTNETASSVDSDMTL